MTRSILIGPPGTGKTSSIISRIETYLVGGGLGSRKSEQFFENLKRFSPTLSPVNEVDDLVLSRTQLVVRAANALHGSVRHRIEWNELYQSGVIGRAHQPVKKFNPDRGIPFDGYAYPRIRQAIIDSIRKALGRSPGDREFRSKMMPMSALVTEEELREWLYIKQRGRLMRMLTELKIPNHLAGGGRVCTTQAAIDQSLVGTHKEKTREINFSP